MSDDNKPDARAVYDALVVIAQRNQAADWTQGGEVRVQAVEALVQGEVSRAMIDEAWPNMKRPESASFATGNATTVVEEAVDPDPEARIAELEARVHAIEMRFGMRRA